MTAVLGLDPSLACTGLAVVVDGVVKVAVKVPTKPESTLRGTRDRVRYIVGQTLKVVGSGADLLTVVEEPYVPQGGKAAGKVIERAWLYGLLMDQLLIRGDVVPVSAAARAKYAADSGRAGKPAVVAAMSARFPDIAIPDSNVADALALAAMGARHLGAPIDGDASQAQLEAMRSVKYWPAVVR